jgi:general secretion pathway protein L
MRREVPKAFVRARDVARELAVWWWGEIRELAAALMRMLPRRHSPVACLRVGARSLTLSRRMGSAWQVVAEIPMVDGRLPENLADLPADLPGARALVMIDESELLFCSFELPLAAERQLSAVLRLLLERALPLPIDQVLFDRQITSRDRSRELLTIRVAVGHRDRVDALRDLAMRLGLVPVGVGPGSDGSLAFNFLVRRRDPLRWRPTALDRRLMQIACGGLAALLVVLGVQWWRERAQVDAEAAQLHAQATRIAADRARVAQEAGPLLALKEIAATRDAAAVLAALSGSMPMSAWFNHVEIAAPARQPGKIRLIGTAASREEALAALRAIPGVGKLEVSSMFNGQLLGPENVELVAEFEASKQEPGS